MSVHLDSVVFRLTKILRINKTRHYFKAKVFETFSYTVTREQIKIHSKNFPVVCLSYIIRSHRIRNYSNRQNVYTITEIMKISFIYRTFVLLAC